MSTTNPDHGRPPADTAGGLAPTPPGSPAASDHGPSGSPSAETIARGHEADHYDNTSVLSVPLLVVLFFVLAFGTVSILFYFIAPSTVDPTVNPQTSDWTKADTNERISRLPEPRPEGLKTRAGDARGITKPELPTGNSPWVQPDDLRVNRTNTPALFQAGWLNPGKTVARIPIDDAMKLAMEQKDYLKIAKIISAPIDSSHKPTAANAGRGAGSSKALPPPPLPAAGGEKPGDEKGGKH